jgi:hypothetical protein
MKEFRSPLNYMWQNMSQRVFDFIRGSRKFGTLPTPVNSGDTINLYLSAPETIIKFSGPIANDFNLFVDPVGAKLGDKLYLIMNNDGSNYTVTSTGSLRFNDCGPDSPPSEYEIESTENVVIPFMFDGTDFVGLDYC